MGALDRAMKIAEPLKDHIKRVHGSNKAYAQHAGVTAPMVSRHIKKRYWVIDGELYGPIKLKARHEDHE